MSYRRYSDGDGWVMLIVLALVVAGFVAYWIARLCWAMLTETVCIYRDYGFVPTKTARMLQVALFAFVGLLVLGTVTAVIFPLTVGADLSLICWSFCAFCVSIAACGWYARKHDLRHGPGWDNLDTYLDFTPASNRRTLDGSKDSEDPAFSRGEGAT